MVEQITCGIKISVETHFEGTFYKDYKINFAFGYQVTIENKNEFPVQLNSRHWSIYDALNNIETVNGKGVIGKQPILQPGELHTYSSGSVFSSPFGAMKGHYNMINLVTNQKFKVAIPAFKLIVPFSIN